MYAVDKVQESVIVNSDVISEIMETNVLVAQNSMMVKKSLAVSDPNRFDTSFFTTVYKPINFKGVIGSNHR
jgi:hypothetical protein